MAGRGSPPPPPAQAVPVMGSGTYGAAAGPAEGGGSGRGHRRGAEPPPPRGRGAPWRPRGEAPRVPPPCQCPARRDPSRRPEPATALWWPSLVPPPVLGLGRSISTDQLIAFIRRPGGASPARRYRRTATVPGPGSPHGHRTGTGPAASPGAALPAQGAARSPPHLESAIESPILSFGATNYLITPRYRAYLSAQLARTIIKIRRPNYVSI